ncbi:UTP--glucose-1-phosphate uridylyltransferase [Candidatus Kuenenbacteria bacterium CG11_big_fil_rev_8_21_14_0_20_37_9]|nr:MAG: UTP--glucose-1-phosphate uridylyltransferase [Candidatus Kuenenbacteria bacterium CG11_big_fil_rev_8_21_14_0_20_37_9]
MQLPKKAIITVAGSGTRFLPATKSQPKEMLPIIDKPIIQYNVEELVNSGIKDIILVTKRGGHAIEDHFDSNFELEHQLLETGKKDKLKTIREISKIANFIYLRQKTHLPYGNATPLLVAKDLVSDAPFLYLFGDDITKSKVPVCQQLIDIYQKNPTAAAVIAAQKIPRKVAYRYGIIKLKKGTSNIYENIVEKPKPGTEPTDLAEFGRFLFTPKILPIIKKLKTGKNKELWLVDAINELAKKEKVIVHEIEGKWLTTGDPLNYLKTTLEFALERDDLKNELKKYIVKKLGI